MMTKCRDLNQLIGNVPKLTEMGYDLGMDTGKAKSFFEDMKIYASKECRSRTTSRPRPRRPWPPSLPGSTRRLFRLPILPIAPATPAAPGRAPGRTPVGAGRAVDLSAVASASSSCGSLPAA